MSSEQRRTCLKHCPKQVIPANHGSCKGHQHGCIADKKCTINTCEKSTQKARSNLEGLRGTRQQASSGQRYSTRNNHHKSFVSTTARSQRKPSKAQNKKNKTGHTLRPKPANQLAPRRRIVGATATVSTLVTVVGQPKTPTLAGNGGFRRGLPWRPCATATNNDGGGNGNGDRRI